METTYMPRLTNTKEQISQLNLFLEKTAINASEIQSFEQCYALTSSSTADATDKASKLAQAFNLENHTSLPSIDLVELLKEAIQHGQAPEQQQAFRTVGLAMLQSALLKPSMDEYGIITFPMPTSFLAVFRDLQLKDVKVTNQGLQIEIQNLLKYQPTDLGFLQLESSQPPLIILKSSALKQKVFYQIEELVDNPDKLKVTPAFLVPRNTTPPQYEFMLDLSGSMQTSMQQLKQSCIAMANMIFEFEPNASIQLNTFDTDVRMGSTFFKKDFISLQYAIDNLSSQGLTALYKAAEMEFDKTNSYQSKNILLFTDGENSTCESHFQSLSRKVNQLLLSDNHGQRGRNKLYIINYGGSHQPQVLHDLTRAFNSQMIDSNNPQLTTALADKGEMEKWAAMRDLFTTSFTVNDGIVTQEAVVALNCSGQLHMLPSQVVDKDATIQTRVTNSFGLVVAENTLNLAPAASVVSDSDYQDAHSETASDYQNAPSEIDGLYQDPSSEIEKLPENIQAAKPSNSYLNSAMSLGRMATSWMKSIWMPPVATEPAASITDENSAHQQQESKLSI